MLKLDNSRERSVFTLGGMLTYSRYYMRPIDDENKNRMVELCGQSGIAPLDEYLGLANLPFLISCEAAIQICRIALAADVRQRIHSSCIWRYRIRVLTHLSAAHILFQNTPHPQGSSHTIKVL